MIGEIYRNIVDGFHFGYFNKGHWPHTAVRKPEEAILQTGDHGRLTSGEFYPPLKTQEYTYHADFP